MQLQPELRPSELDQRSDVYSLAFVLWELLTLNRPWKTNQVQVDWDATVRAIRDHRAHVTPQLPLNLLQSPALVRLTRTLRRALEFDREARTQSAAELAMELRICASPSAWLVFHPEESRWGRVACRFPIVVSAVAIILPNVVAAVFNYHYNLAWLTARYPASHATFIDISVLLNGVAFALGSICFFFIVGPVAHAIARHNQGTHKQARNCHGTMSLGQKAANISLSLWLVFGLFFPLLLGQRLPQFDRNDAIHFFLSLAICGAIASAYPFLMMSLIELECWLGATLGKRLPIDFALQAERLTKSSGRYLLAAAGVPFLGIALVLTQSVPLRPALSALVVAGAAGLFFAYWVHGRIQKTLEVVSDVVLP